jgi:hypothetical protein
MPSLKALMPPWLDLFHAGGTGGLSWHLHAWRSLARWQATVQHLDGFLAKVQPQTPHLLLIGGSAGWMMPPSWLARFQTVAAYDIDPLAARLFTRRHGAHLQQHGVQVTHHRQDALATLPELLRQHPNACVWFDNVLGQHRFRIGDVARAEKELQNLKVHLKGRAWGSVHDLYSGPTNGNPILANIPARLALSGAEVKAISQTLLSSVGATGEWRDHLTQDVFPQGTATHLVPWAFRRDDWHWLQAGWIEGR